MERSKHCRSRNSPLAWEFLPISYMEYSDSPSFSPSTILVMHPNRYLSVFYILLTSSDLIIVESMDKDKFCATFMFLDSPDPSHTPIILQTFTRFMISATESP